MSTSYSDLAALAAPKILTELPGPNAKRLIETDEAISRPLPTLACIRWRSRAVRGR